MKKCIVSLVLVFALASFASAGPFSRFRSRFSNSCSDGSCSPQQQYQPQQYQPQQVAPQAPPTKPASFTDALAEVNAERARHGLPPFIKDAGLTQAAQSAATYRASYRIEGHTNNDFAHLPAGCSADAAGCAAWAPGTGWGSCCTHDNYSHAGAAWAIGADGRRYMHLFVRGGGFVQRSSSYSSSCANGQCVETFQRSRTRVRFRR